MLPELYQKHLKTNLSQSQFLTLEILVWLLQVHKQVKIERLAACFPLPILFESRRRKIQSFLLLKQLALKHIWFPVIREILSQHIKPGKRRIIALDRSQWGDNNILMVSLIWKKRALPLYWEILDKKGASNLDEQKAVISPVIELLKDSEMVVIGDREFHSIRLADWLSDQNVLFALRQKRNTYIRQLEGDYQQLKQLGLKPGTSLFFQEAEVTKEKGFGRFNLAGYWKRKYRGKVSDEGWFILTNLPTLEKVLEVYRARMGIEAMFKDCKTGGYNLEGSKASEQRLSSLVLLIAIAYTCATLRGQIIKQTGQQKYISRLTEMGRLQRRHSDFWVGLYGQMWIPGMEFCWRKIQQLMALSPSHLSYYQRGLSAMSVIQKAVSSHSQ